MLDLIADIRDEPAILLANRQALDLAFAEVGPSFPPDEQLVITGMATSLWAWHSAGLVMQRLPQAPLIVDTSEYLRFGDPQDDPRPLLITSRSGESAELVKLLDVVRPGRSVTGMTLLADSTLSRRAQRLLQFEASERAFYNTSSFVLSMGLALAVAAAMAGRRDLAPGEWANSIAEHVDKVVQRPVAAFDEVSTLLSASRIVLLSARGHLIGVAQQACLDLQEGMRIGAIPVPGGLLRHGPMELVTLPDCAILMLIPNDHMAATSVRTVEDLLSHGARVAAVVGDGVRLPAGCRSVAVPDVGAELSPIVFAAALHMMNVSLGQALGLSEIRPTLIPKITSVE